MLTYSHCRCVTCSSKRGSTRPAFCSSMKSMPLEGRDPETPWEATPNPIRHSTSCSLKWMVSYYYFHQYIFQILFKERTQLKRIAICLNLYGTKMYKLIITIKYNNCKNLKTNQSFLPFY